MRADTNGTCEAARPIVSNPMGIDRRILVLVCALGLTLAGCSFGPSQPETVARQFTEALNAADIRGAAALTNAPERAGPALGALFDNLGQEAAFRLEGTEDDDFTLAATWKLGGGGRAEWNYRTSGAAADTDQGWKIQWDPATVAPGLASGPPTFAPVYPEPARVLDAAGVPLLSEQAVTVVQVAPGADTAALAALLSPIAPGISTASLDADLAAANGGTIAPISLRDNDIAPIRDSLTATAGVTLAPQTRLLTTERTVSAAALSGLRELWQKRADEAAGWVVRAQGPDGPERIAGQAPRPTNDIRTSIDAPLQGAAEAALEPVDQAAAIVALRPSTGQVLATAQNAAADEDGPVALTGLYPPGSTFKTVTTAAALETGVASPDTVLPCPGVADVEGRRIPNDDSFELGDVPLHTAFAHSCNTTMARLAVQLPGDALTRTAERLGLGVDYVTPGLTTVTGSVPPAEAAAQRVESSIGQGRVTASPFGMALVAASVVDGSPPVPALVEGEPGVADRTPAPLPPEVSENVRTMMRETVTSGTASALGNIPDLLGKTGTAEYGDNTNAHGWFIGAQGDLAFAVFVADAGSSGPAVDAAGRMLRAPR